MFGSFLGLLAERPDVYATVILTVIVSITFHELAHGFVAMRLGDDTPEWSGHMTFNPLVHMGPFSLLACFLAGIAWGQMPIDPSRIRGRHGDAIVSAAGPAVNFAFAILAFTALGLWLRFGGAPEEASRAAQGMMVLEVFGSINFLLGVFNLVPVPPLDGSKILASYNRGYADWIYDPKNQGVGLLLFIGAFFVARPIAAVLGNIGMAYVGLLAGV